MNPPPLGCRCPNNSPCQCGYQAWVARYNQAYVARFAPQGPAPLTPRAGVPPNFYHLGPPPPFMHVSGSSQATTPSRQAPQSQGPLYYQSSIPFPTMWPPAPPTVQAAAAAPAAAPVAAATAKRKRTTASASSTGPAKKKQAPRTSTTTRASTSAPINTSHIAGVGPSTPIRPPIVSITPPTPSSSSAPSATLSSANAQSTSTNPTYRAVADKNAEIAKSKRERPGGALNVWWFMRPVEVREAPVPLPPPEDLTRPIIRVKPEAPFVACRMCLCSNPQVWQVWKNGSGGITSTIRSHLNNKHGPAYHKAIEQGPAELKAQPSLNRIDDEDEEFDLEMWLDHLMDFMVVSDQPMSLVDGKEFRRFALYGRKEVKDEDLPHRTAMTTRIMNRYVEEYDALVEEIRASLGRISFTSNIWSDPQLAAFLAMTAHWCRRNPAGGLEVVNRLLAFRIVETAHDGENLGQLMYDIIKDAGANHKIGQITLDNASNCDTSMQKIQRCCAKDGIAFDADGNHCRCFPHIINISAQTMTKELKEHPEMVTKGALAMKPTYRDDPTKSAYLDQYQLAVDGDPVGKTRGLVSACRASGGRRADFRQTITDGNKDGTWTLPAQQLLRDVDTRWSAMHLMVCRVLDLSPAIKFFLDKPKHKEISHHGLNEIEYDFLHDLQEVFELPHATQELLSAEKTPTLCYALPAFEILIDSLLRKQRAIPELSHFIGVGVNKIIEYSNKCRKSRVYAFAMVLNPVYKFSWIKVHWSPPDAINARLWVLDTMTAFATSRRKKAETQTLLPSARPTLVNGTLQSSSERASASLGSGLQRLIGLQSNASFRRRSTHSTDPAATASSAPSPIPPPADTPPDPQPSAAPSPQELAEAEAAKVVKDREIAEDELDRYSRAPLEPPDLNGTTLVRYWDLNEMKYPLLFRIALDVLPAQASAVPCERVFSSSKRTCDDHRNRMNAKLFEALQFQKHSLNKSRLDFTDHHVAHEEDYTIEGPVTDKAARELLARGDIDTLTELLHNSV